MSSSLYGFVNIRRTDKDTMRNDMALLKLLEPAALHQDGFINAICLPSTSRSLPLGSVCLAAGWGKLGSFSFSVDFNISYARSAYRQCAVIN